jgi:hypothetical protein
MTDYIRRYPIHPVQSCKSQRQYRLLEARYAIAGQTAIVHQVGDLRGPDWLYLKTEGVERV